MAKKKLTETRWWKVLLALIMLSFVASPVFLLISYLFSGLVTVS